MLLLNFSHPLTAGQLNTIRELTGRRPERVVEVKTDFDHARPFAEQTRRLVESVCLSPGEWQTELLVVNLPSFSAIAALLLAELHGRMGYFPPIIRLRPVAGATPPRFEVAEILNLQAVRDEVRRQR